MNVIIYEQLSWITSRPQSQWASQPLFCGGSKSIPCPARQSPSTAIALCTQTTVDVRRCCVTAFHVAASVCVCEKCIFATDCVDSLSDVCTCTWCMHRLLLSQTEFMKSTSFNKNMAIFMTRTQRRRVIDFQLHNRKIVNLLLLFLPMSSNKN